MSVFFKKNTRRLSFLAVAFGGALLAFFGFNTGGGEHENLTVNERLFDFFAQEVLADSNHSEDSSWWNFVEGGDGAYGGDGGCP